MSGEDVEVQGIHEAIDIGIASARDVGSQIRRGHIRKVDGISPRWQRDGRAGREQILCEMELVVISLDIQIAEIED